MKKELLTNNNGTSIKSWLLHITTMTAIYILLVLGTVLLIDGIYNKTLLSNLEYFAPIIDSCAALIFAGSIPKISGEIKEAVETIKNKFKKKEDE